MEWIIKSLKEDGIALVVIPDGLLSNLANTKLRKYILDKCYIEGIISLPINTFFGTPKKTYILSIRKKSINDLDETKKQEYPVFKYICNSIGESLDVYRFDIENNDLEEAVNQYKFYRASSNKSKFKAITYDKNEELVIDKKWKLIPIDEFYKNVEKNWIIDKYWSDEEKIELGFKEKANIMNIQELQSFIDVIIDDMNEYKEDLKCLT